MPRFAVAGPNTSVTEAASVAAQSGASIVDVAVVASLVAMCTEPGVCAPGGGGYLTISVAGQDPVVIDGYVTAPGLGHGGEVFHRTVTMEYGGGVTTLVDAGSIAVPGAFAALAEASRMFGAMPWKDLMEVVASVVEVGFPLGPAAHLYFQDAGEPIYAKDPASRAALFKGERLRDMGDTIVFEDLADSIRLIGEEGADVLYKGDLGAAIVDDLSARGSMLTREDLAEYEVVVRRPLGLELEGWTLSTNPPPAVGGVMLCAALGMISGTEGRLSGSVWGNALLAAFRTRVERLEPAADLAGESFRLLGEIATRSPSTIAVSVAAEDGSAVATSFSAGYGSGIIPKGTGLLMNNCLGEIELTPGGLEAQPPGQRLLSNMAPAIVRSDAGAIALASPGADRITSALTIALARAVFAGDDLMSAIEHPRIHPELADDGDRFAAEPGLDASGLELPVRWFDAPHMYFGGVNGAATLDGEVLAHADRRRTGAAVVI
ncbi:MAG: gamma-glutamyltransferase [Acidimicrobiia bacterium]|nr:gamma-glutamyltransferase [Acidimicrobiia bacterium]